MCDYETLSKGVYKKTQNLPLFPYLTKATVPANSRGTSFYNSLKEVASGEETCQEKYMYGSV